jgi:hypothetical protein
MLSKIIHYIDNPNPYMSKSKTGWLGIRIMHQSRKTCLSVKINLLNTITDHAHNLYRMSSNLRSIAYDLHYCPGSKNYRRQNKMTILEDDIKTLPEHLSSPPVFVGIRVTRSLVLYVCFVDCCLSFGSVSFGHCVVLTANNLYRRNTYLRYYIEHRHYININSIQSMMNKKS